MKNKGNKNNKKKWQKIALIIGGSLATLFLAGILAFGFSFKSGAFGDYNDFDYDSGDSDWGSSDWGSSSSDWGDSDYSGGGSSGGLIWWLVSLLFSKNPCLGVIVIIAIIVFVTIRSNIRKKHRNDQQIQGGNRNYIPPAQSSVPRRQAPLANLNIPNRDNEIGEIIKKNDPNFTVPDFITFAKNLYINMQDAWCRRDLEPVRAGLHQNLYERSEKQIQKKIADGIVVHLDRLTVNEAYITSYRRDSQYEYAKVYLSSSMIEYHTKEATGQILYGDMQTRWTMRYEMTFMRSVNAKTNEAGAANIGLNCPNCGAPLKGTSFGKCAYCDSIVTTGMYNWVLSDFNAIKNEFRDEGIQIQDPN